MKIMRNILKFFLILLLVFIGVCIALYAYFVFLSRDYLYEVKTLDSSNYIGTQYTSEKPLVYLKNLEQPLGLKGSRPSAGLNAGLSTTQGAYCISVSPKTTTRLDSLPIKDWCDWLRNSNDSLKFEYIPIGTSFKILGQHQLIQYRKPRQSSESIINYFLIEDQNGNTSEVELEHFIENVVTSEDRSDKNDRFSRRFKEIKKTIPYIEENGSVSIIFCPEYSGSNDLQELMQLTDKFGLENSFKVGASDDTCPHGAVLEISSVEAYLMANEFSSSVAFTASWTIKE